MATVSENIAKWVATTHYDNIPQEVINIAKRSILDFIGVTLAGSRQPITKIVQEYLNDFKAPEQSTVIGLGIKTSCIEAAFANGSIGHCLDYDDYLIPVIGGGGPHVTAAIFPAALAIAEKENKSGKQLIEAYVLGCEVCYRIGRGVDPTHYNLGWHSTGTEGIFGAAVAVSKLLGLSCEETAYALGIAGSEASGLRENFGTMTKPFHAGQASAKGIKASLLAKLGFNSSKSIFEGKNGFCNVMSKNARLDEITRSMGQPFCLPQITLKLYPCCGGSHSAICAMLELVKAYDFSIEDIEKIEVKCPPSIPQVLVYETPKTALEGMFSMQFPLALAVSERRVTLQEFTDEKVKDPGIVSLMSTVKTIAEPELLTTVVEPATVWVEPAIVEIRFRDGRQLVRRCDFPPGTAQNPIPDKELIEKYKSCARLVLAEKELEESIKLITNLERIDNIGKLLNLLHS